jgi:hypothetical protein
MAPNEGFFEGAAQEGAPCSPATSVEKLPISTLKELTHGYVNHWSERHGGLWLGKAAAGGEGWRNVQKLHPPDEAEDEEVGES